MKLNFIVGNNGINPIFSLIEWYRISIDFRFEYTWYLLQPNVH